MQTKKRIAGRTTSRELNTPRISRTQKKAPDNVQANQKKATELITSSARKQKCGMLPSSWWCMYDMNLAEMAVVSKS